jgi:hypothetical protein
MGDQHLIHDAFAQEADCNDRSRVGLVPRDPPAGVDKRVHGLPLSLIKLAFRPRTSRVLGRQ